jgi:hypothetical protein
MAILPLATDSATTTGAGGAVTVASLTLPNLYFGMLRFVLTGEKAGDPTQTFSWECEALYSCNAGVATMRSQGVPIILDPDGYAWTVTLDQTGASARVTVTGIAGQNWVWSAAISNVGRTRLPLGTTSYIDASVNASVTADFVYTGAQLIVDGDMELAGVANYPQLAGLVPDTETKEAGGNPGQCLRIADATAVAVCYQSAIPASTRVNISCYLRASAGAAAAVYDGVSSAFSPALYTTNGAWTSKAAVNQWNVTLATSPQLWKANAVAGYAEFDNLSAIRLPIASAVADQIIGGPGVAQATAANRPVYIDAGDYFLFDGSSQWFNTNFTPTPEFTVGCWWYFDSIAAGTTCIIGSVPTGGLSQMLRIGSLLQIYVGANALNHPTALTVGWHHVMFGRSGTTMKVWLDGVPATGLNAGEPSSRVMYAGARNNAGVADSFISGRMGNFLANPRLLADAEILDLYNGTYRS